MLYMIELVSVVCGTRPLRWRRARFAVVASVICSPSVNEMPIVQWQDAEIIQRRSDTTSIKEYDMHRYAIRIRSVVQVAFCCVHTSGRDSHRALRYVEV